MSKDKKSKGKPIVQMDDLERRRTLDEMFSDNHRHMLDDARKQNPDNLDKLQIACAFLVMPGEAYRLAHNVAEYGDADGIDNILEFARQIRRNKHLKDGERIECRLIEISPEGMAYRPLSDPPPPSAKRKRP